MTKGLLKTGLVIFTLTTMLWHIHPVAAKTTKDIEATISKKKIQQKKLSKKAKKLSTEVTGLQSKLVRTTKKLRAAEHKLSTAENNLKKLKHKKAYYLEQLYAGQSALGGLAAASRKYQETPAILMFLYRSPLEAARTALIMKSITPQLQVQATALQKQLSELDKVENKIKTNLAARKKSKKKLDREQVAFSNLLQDRKSIYKKTESARKTQQAEMKKLAQEAKNLTDLISKIQPKRKPKKSRPSLAVKKRPSNIPQPVNGTVLTGFGQKDGMGSKSKGITFSARSGSAVTSPMAGTVKFAGPFKNFKQILIIEHREGYHSLIAGLGRIDTVVGASLVAGEPVGITKNNTSESRVYYELLHNGTPINPKNNILAQRKQDKI